MTISEIIKELQAYTNQDATVTIEIGTEDTDSIDANGFELFSDTSEDGYITLYVDVVGLT